MEISIGRVIQTMARTRNRKTKVAGLYLGERESCNKQRLSHERLVSHAKDTGFNSECLRDHADFYTVKLHDLMYIRRPFWERYMGTMQAE